MSQKDSSNNEWLNEKYETLYNEAKSIIEYQKQDLQDIDDKAMRTVRMEIILFGILVSGIQVLNIEINYTWLYIGGIFLFFSIFFGLLTYTESNLVYGPNKEYLENLIKNNINGKRWDEDLLYSYSLFIEANEEVVSLNGTLLAICEGLLFISILCLGLSVTF